MSPARILGNREPESSCDYCRALEDEPCEGECDCLPCEVERALDDDAGAYLDRCRD